MAVKKREEKVGEALLKVALGCRVEEVTEEYAEVDGELKLTKRRETKKDIPPDLKAVQMLLQRIHAHMLALDVRNNRADKGRPDKQESAQLFKHRDIGMCNIS